MSDETNESPPSAPHAVRVAEIAGALRKVVDAWGDKIPGEARAQLALVAMDLDHLGRALESGSTGSASRGLPRKFDRRRH